MLLNWIHVNGAIFLNWCYIICNLKWTISKNGNIFLYKSTKQMNKSILHKIYYGEIPCKWCMWIAFKVTCVFGGVLQLYFFKKKISHSYKVQNMVCCCTGLIIYVCLDVHNEWSGEGQLHKYFRQCKCLYHK